jgi:hypothetical protein
MLIFLAKKLCAEPHFEQHSSMDNEVMFVLCLTGMQRRARGVARNQKCRQVTTTQRPVVSKNKNRVGESHPVNLTPPTEDFKLDVAAPIDSVLECP